MLESLMCLSTRQDTRACRGIEQYYPPAGTARQVWKALPTTAEHAFFSGACGTHTKIDHDKIKELKS